MAKEKVKEQVIIVPTEPKVMPKGDVILTGIAPEDLIKVQREVGYNKVVAKPPDSGLAEREMPEKRGSIDTAINASMNKLDPKYVPKELPYVPRKLGSNKKIVAPVMSVDDAIASVSPTSVNTDLSKEEASIVSKALDVSEPEPKMILVEFIDRKIDVTFTGKGWKILDIKLAYMSLIKGIRLKIRDEYREGNKR